MRLPILTNLLALGALTTGFVTAPASAFWCEGRLVLEGDRSYEVRSRCGEPASEITRMESRSFYRGAAVGRGGGTVYGGSADTITVQVDIWVYDFGPTRFMEELRFHDGILVQMTRLGRGTRRSELVLPEASRDVRLAQRERAITRRRAVRPRILAAGDRLGRPQSANTCATTSIRTFSSRPVYFYPSFA